MRDLRIDMLRWAIGAFCATVGALMLVAPHQFGSPAYATLRLHLPAWGAAFLLGGTGLLLVAALDLGRLLAVVAHVFVGAALLLLAIGFVATGLWNAVAFYGVVGAGTALAALVPRPSSRPSEHARDLIAVLLGVGATVHGVITLVWPGQFGSSLYDSVRPFLLWYGLAFLCGGLAVLAVQLLPTPPRAAVRLAHPLLAGAFFFQLLAVSVPNSAWIGIVFYGELGAVVGLLPWLNSRLLRLDPASLRTRLACALAVAAALPLIAVAGLEVQQEEHLVRAEVLVEQQTLAANLVEDVADYIELHRAAVAALAAQPDLLRLPVESQRAAVLGLGAIYPNMLTFNTFDADGNGIARGDGRPPIRVAGQRVYEDARQANGPALEILQSPIFHRPVFALGEPVRGPDGRFDGFVVGVLDSARVAERLARANVNPGGGSYLVDAAVMSSPILTHPW